jgi:hypothetical protein
MLSPAEAISQPLRRQSGVDHRVAGEDETRGPEISVEARAILGLLAIGSGG